MTTLEPTFRLAEYAEVIDMPARRVQFMTTRGIIQPTRGGGIRGRHWRFTKDEARLGRLIVALDQAGLSLEFMGHLAVSFRKLYLPAASPKLATGALVEDIFEHDRQWRQRIRDALRGESVYLLIGRPVVAGGPPHVPGGPPPDPKAHYQLRLLRTAEVAKTLSDKDLKHVTVMILVNLGQLWAGLGER